MKRRTKECYLYTLMVEQELARASAGATDDAHESLLAVAEENWRLWREANSKDERERPALVVSRSLVFVATMATLACQAA